MPMTQEEAYRLLAKNCFDMDRRWAELDSYVDSVNKFLLQSQRRLNAKYSKGESPFNGGLFAEPYPNLLHSSILILAVTIIEQETRGYARALKTALSLDLALNDLSGSWLERFKKYAVRLAGMDFGLSELQWQDTQDIVEIRNCVVHTGGCLDGFSRAQQVRLFATRHDTPIIVDNRLLFSHDTSIVMLGVGGAFLGSIYDAAANRFPKVWEFVQKYWQDMS